MKKSRQQKKNVLEESGYIHITASLSSPHSLLPLCVLKTISYKLCSALMRYHISRHALRPQIDQKNEKREFSSNGKEKKKAILEKINFR